MVDDEVAVKLIPFGEEITSQEAYEVFALQVAAGEVEIAAETISMEDATSQTYWLGQYIIPLAQVVVPAVGLAVAAWFQARSGRKMRLKIGDIEIEANSKQEVGEFLKQAVAAKNELNKAVSKSE